MFFTDFVSSFFFFGNKQFNRCPTKKFFSHWFIFRCFLFLFFFDRIRNDKIPRGFAIKQWQLRCSFFATETTFFFFWKFHLNITNFTIMGSVLISICDLFFFFAIHLLFCSVFGPYNKILSVITRDKEGNKK